MDIEHEIIKLYEKRAILCSYNLMDSEAIVDRDIEVRDIDRKIIKLSRKLKK